MYLYFDRNGVLKEIINDLPARVGNSQWNRIYCYWEGTNQAVSNVWIKYFLPNSTYFLYNGTTELPWNIGNDPSHGIYTGGHYIPNAQDPQASDTNCFIPYEKNRDLKFFEYFKPYEFYMFVVPDNVMAVKGSIGITINYVTPDSVIAMGQYGENAFYVASDGADKFEPDENINVAQWNELKKLIGQGGGGETTNHALLSNLSYENAGHTGFQQQITQTNKLSYDLISGTPDLTDMATKTWVEGNNYATQTWVENKGYITSSALTDYATKTYVDNADNVLSGDIATINSKIPSQATSSNQLADKAFVNSSIASNTGTFKGTFNSVSDLPTSDVHNNDYAFVVGVDAQGNTVYNRYKYNGTSWVFEYALNNSSFTANQWASINSGISSSDVSKLNGIEAGAEVNDIVGVQYEGTNLTIDANRKVNVPKEIFVCTYGSTTYNEITQAITNGKIPICKRDDKIYIFGALYDNAYRFFAYSYSNQVNQISVSSNNSWSDFGLQVLERTSYKTQSISSSSTTSDYPSAKATYDALQLKANVSDLSTVATSGSYNDLSNKPTIPIVNDATLTIQKNGTTIDTFTANSNVNKTVNVVVPTKTSDIDNDSGFITSADIPSEVFVCVFNSTTFNDIATAVSNNKIPIVKKDNKIYYYQVSNATQHWFIQIDNWAYTHRLYVNNNNVWKDDGTIGLQTQALTTTITSASTNTQYPSAKAVYDNLQLKQNTLTFDNTPTQSSDNPVKSSGIYSAIENVREIAEGKKQTYVVSDITNPDFNTQNSIIETSSFIDEDNVTHTWRNVQIGDSIYVQELDVPDRWVNGFVSSTLPIKSDIIKMSLDGTQREYRVTNINGNIAELLSMFTVSTITFDSDNSNVYENSDIDTYLNTTWYNTLTETAKSAIVEKIITQDQWAWNGAGDPSYSGYYGYNEVGTNAYSISMANQSYGNQITRKVYLLSVKDVLDYVTDTNIGDGLLQSYNVRKMYWNSRTQPTPVETIWTRSACSGSSSVMRVYADRGFIDYYTASSQCQLRPSLSIDLSKISYEIVGGQQNYNIKLSKLETAKVPITSISKNGVNISPINNNVNITVPTNSDYVDLATQQTITGYKTFVEKPTVGVSILPAGYQQVDYLESDGNCFINTNVKINLLTDRFIIDLAYLENTNAKGLFGDGNGSQMYLQNYNYAGTIRFYFRRVATMTGESSFSIGNISLEQRISIDFNKGDVYLNGVLKNSQIKDFELIEDTNPFGLFATTTNTEGSTYVFNSKGRIYGCMIYKQDVLVRNMIPCFNANTNILGMYDIVNDVFYANGGSGVFTYGRTEGGTPVALYNELPTKTSDLTNDSGYINPTTITGYDATKTQVLKNVNGTLTWVDET